MVSEKGWIRALRGQVADLSGLAFKADDGLKLAFFAETTSKILVFATNGRFYTIEAAKLPGGRGHGEPIRLFIDLEQEADIVAVFRYQGGRKLIVASGQGRGFVVPEDECLGNTRKGKQVLNVKAPDDGVRARTGRGRTRGRDRREPQDGDLPDRSGAGDDARPRRAPAAPQGRRPVRRQDLQGAEGLSWTDSAGRVFNLSLKELADWRGNRADAGRLAPKGFPKTNKFDDTAGRAIASEAGNEES